MLATLYEIYGNYILYAIVFYSRHDISKSIRPSYICFTNDVKAASLYQFTKSQYGLEISILYNVSVVFKIVF